MHAYCRVIISKQYATDLYIILNFCIPCLIRSMHVECIIDMAARMLRRGVACVARILDWAGADGLCRHESLKVLEEFGSGL